MTSPLNCSGASPLQYNKRVVYLLHYIFLPSSIP